MAERKPKCRCACGYRCGGPGVCKLDPFECLQRDDGEHFVRDCDHDWKGPWVKLDDHAQTASCSKCGETAMAHDCAVGP